MSYAIPMRGGASRVILFDETTGVALDAPTTALLPYTPGAEEETRVPTADGGWRVDTRSNRFGVAAMRPDVARIMTRLRHDAHRLSGWQIGWPSAKGGAHTAFLDACTAGGSQSGQVPFGTFGGHVVEMETRRRHPAAWTSTDLLSGVPWTGQAAVDLGSATKDLPYVPRITGSALETLYEAPGAMLPGPTGYTGPVWAVESGADVGGDTFLTSGTVSTDTVCVLPLPAPGLVLSAEAVAVDDGSSDTATITLAAYSRAGALLDSDAGDGAVDGATDSAALTLPYGTWYVAVSIDGPLAAAPVLWVTSATGSAPAVLYTYADGDIVSFPSGAVLYSP